jgi:signal transduction histidine kinase
LEIITVILPKVKISLVAFFLLFSVGSNSLAQSKLDSLERILKNSSSDSVRFITLISLSKENQYKDLTKASAYSAQALALAEKNQWVWGKSRAYGQESFLATISGDYATAMKYDNQNLQLVIEQKDSLSIAQTLGYLGNDYKDLGKYDEAYYYFTQSYNIARSIPDSLKMTIAIHNIGTVLSDLGQYDLALDHFKVSTQISTAINDLDGIAYDLDAVGDVYCRKKDYKKSEEYLLKGLNNIRELKLTVIEPRALTHLAHLYYVIRDLPKSLAYYDSATMVYDQTSNEFGDAEVNLGISQVLIEQGKFDEAQILIEKSLKTAESLGAERMEIDCYEKLSKLAERKGDYKSALAYHKNFKAMEDSLFSQEMVEKVFQDQLRFQTETKDFQIANLSKVTSAQDNELRRQEFLSNILAVVVALTAILLFSVYRSGQRRKRINKLLIEHQEEIKKRSIELEQLNQVKDKFFSIISHDLRSPMNALSGILDLLSEKQITQEEFAVLTREMRVQFNHTRTLINNLLDWALLQMDKLNIQPEKIELSKVINENFTLVKSLHLKEMNLVNKVEPGIFGWGDLNMINLIFRNLILNAIKFSDKGGLIEISSKQEGDFHVMAIKDYGVGINPEVQKILFDKTTGYSTRGTANEKGTGLGLILCKEFIEKNGGKIWLESEEGKGSTFYFTIKKA